MVQKATCSRSFGVTSVIVVPAATAQIEPFVVADIRVEGLRLHGSVFAALPIGVGDIVDEPSVRAVSRNLFSQVTSTISLLGETVTFWLFRLPNVQALTR